MLRLRFDGHRDNGFGERRRFERHVEIFVAQRVTRRDVAQTDERGDVAGVNFVDVLTLAALNHHEPGNAFTFARARIVNRVAFFEVTGINAEEHQLARVRIGPEFERERTELRVIGRRHFDHDFRAKFVTLRTRNVNRAGQIINDRVHEDLHGFLLERRTAQHGHEFNLASETANGGLQNRRRNGLFFQHEFRDGVVLVGNGINQFRERGLGAFLIFGSDFFNLVIETFVRFARTPINCLLVDDVNDAFKTAFDRLAFGFNRPLTERQENGERIRLQLRAHIIERILKIRAHAIHLVHERDARNIVFRRLTPDGFRLRLHARNAAEHSDCAVEHAHGTFHFGGKINVSRRINNVDAMRNVVERLVNLVFARPRAFLRPETGDGGGRDRDAAFFFLLHPVGHGVAVIHVTNFVDESRVKQNTFGRRRLARVNVRGDADVAGAFEGVFAIGRIG